MSSHLKEKSYPQHKATVMTQLCSADSTKADSLSEETKNWFSLESELLPLPRSECEAVEALEKSRGVERKKNVLLLLQLADSFPGVLTLAKSLPSSLAAAPHFNVLKTRYKIYPEKAFTQCLKYKEYSRQLEPEFWIGYSYFTDYIAQSFLK